MMFIGKYLLPKAELDANQEIEQEIEATVHDSKKTDHFRFDSGSSNRCYGT